MKKIFTLLLTSVSLFANAQTIVEWKFNSLTDDADFSTGSIIPSIGSGTITNVGLINNIFFDGVGSSDPNVDNTAYSTFNYPTTTDADKTAGIEISVNTTGYSGISLKFDMRCFPTASNEYIVQYSTDGSSFNDFQTINVATADAGIFVNNYTINASSIIGLNNNPNVKFRIVSSFEGNGTSYRAVNNPSDIYDASGTVKFDMLSVISFSVLPVTLSSFTGSYTNKTSLLKWTAANEINISKYAVERSEDGRTFTEIGFVNATGGTDYSYTDATAKNAVNFYRLKIVGVNEAKFSGIVKILSDAFTTKLNVYPSPAVNTVNAEFTSENKQMANVQFTNASGKIILQKSTAIQTGYNNLAFDISTLNKGMYILKITTGTNTISAVFNKL